ncbi:MAG: ABC transporter substrate-binding protein [Bacteroides sp.]|nr:ABC transporter substrate-binding protein [Eubacterium sp.]MCM1417982.1 ABC transporter substrate-binding protein [Roseburia sp.]MCM1461771.1 ABC transporter substrate-binding protein [Bacteroides sp.]
MKMKKILAGALACAALMSVSACGAAEGSGEKLRVGAEVGYPPFEYYDADGVTAIGVDIELGKAIAEKMGVEYELVDTAWDGIFAGLDKGDYDCVISAVTVTPERSLNYLFSDTYIENYQCLVTMKDAEIKPASPDEVAGLRVGYQEETTSDIFITDYAKTNNIDFEPYEYAKVIDVYSDLEAGRLDAVICDSTVADSYLGEGSKFERTWMQDSDPELFAVCIQKENTELQSKINAAIAEIKADGTLDEILAKYF